MSKTNLNHLQSVRIFKARDEIGQMQARLNELLRVLEAKKPCAGLAYHLGHDIGSCQKRLNEHLINLED
ncbi:hypothetical protein [Vibrio mediterranei]|uniref:Uncharacterized protein n=1 Tax=Vibrio mediterranei TaxID=689 RepID=A0ABX5D8Y3_9VIBR|nr:hypothetical protein [Vibrio mediterranei]PRQ65126.1 hypothetical protein COR51_23685 [Vibrio mediterranei]